MFKYIKMSWRNMWRNWRRTAIALVAIVLGLVLLLFMDGMIAGSDQAIFGNAVKMYGGSVQVHAPGYVERASRMPLLPLDDADAVVAAAYEQPEVVTAAKRINTGGMLSSHAGAYPVAITAIEPSVEAQVSLQAANVAAGRYLDDADLDAIFIGDALADLLDVSVGDKVMLLGRAKNETMRQRTMTVVGAYGIGVDEIEKGLVYITIPEAQDLYGLTDEVTEVALSLEQLGQESKVIPRLEAALPGYEVDSWDTLRPEIRETMDSKSVITNFFGFLVVFIASIGILNLMMMAVYERTREMGVMAALGMKGRQIMGMFLMEGALIGAVGAFIGCSLGLLLNGILIQTGGIDYSFASGMGEITALMGDSLVPTISFSSTIQKGVLVIGIAALASLYPAWQASRAEPAEALHHV